MPTDHQLCEIKPSAHPRKLFDARGLPLIVLMLVTLSFLLAQRYDL